jgi:5-methylcytosine-specific restriction endonuclease McrBC regulatory subunit McrC
MSIPIRNVYYMLCYAWEHWAEGETVSVDDVDFDFDRTQDLLAHILAEGTARLLKRGLDRGYIPIADDVPGIRGKLDFATTSKRALLARAQTHCSCATMWCTIASSRPRSIGCFASMSWTTTCAAASPACTAGSTRCPRS